MNLFNPSQAEVRQFFVETARKLRDRLPLTPLENMAGLWITQHPEYDSILTSVERALQATPHSDEPAHNPFLHLSMHLAIAEQLSIDQPPGIKQVHDRFVHGGGDAHEAAHRMMEALGEVLFQAQKNATTPDGQDYLDRIARRF